MKDEDLCSLLFVEKEAGVVIFGCKTVTYYNCFFILLDW